MIMADDELEKAGVMGLRCAKVCFDDYILRKQVIYIFNNNNKSIYL